MTNKVKVIDLRSDTVTKPTLCMKQAIKEAVVGDDVFGEDPTVNELESKVAKILGKDAALFVTSGTMANLIATMIYCQQRGSEMLCGDQSHVYKREGSIANLANVVMTPLKNKEDGTFDLDDMKRHIRGSNIHEAITCMVSIENTHSFCGGKVLPLNWLENLAAVAKTHKIAVHMDGARLFNASEFLHMSPAVIAIHCDSLSVCFSKGLGAPVGSALAGTKCFIDQARRYRKMLGGGMRQAGVIAAAALVALDETVPLLAEDHRRALHLAKEIAKLNSAIFEIDIEKQQTNIVQVKIKENSNITSTKIAELLTEVRDTNNATDSISVLASAKPDPKTIRFVFHYDITDDMLYKTVVKIVHVFKFIEENCEIEEANYNKEI